MGLKNELLKGVDLFSALDDGQLDTVAQMLIEKSYRKGDIILMEDDESNQSLFIIPIPVPIPAPLFRALR